MYDRIYITTTIPYVNAAPHVGFALELVQADALARWHRQRGATVRLQTGTDENAFKNVLSARRAGVGVRELVDRNAARFEALAAGLDISAGRFVRTATAEHRSAVDAFIGRLRSDDLYRARYRGLYCPGCEDFFREREVGSAGCPDHGDVLEEIEEENVFFRLSRYQGAVAELVRSGRLRVSPATRRTEVLRFVERGLQDISISRDRARTDGWGLPFPGDDTQVVYVWIDALVNYLTGLGFPGPRAWRFWDEGSRRIHIVGKNVWKFHAVYWPALLLSAELPLPDDLFVHGFLTQEGRKISKSSGGTADPLSFVQRYGADAVRYFLLRHVRPFEDSDFSEARLAKAYEGELANGLGNLVSRLAALCERFGVAGAGAQRDPSTLDVAEHVEAYRFDRALDVIWQDIARVNREIAEARPWEAAPGSTRARSLLGRWTDELNQIATQLAPFLPQTARTLLARLRAPSTGRTDPLFPRILRGTPV